MAPIIDPRCEPVPPNCCRNYLQEPQRQPTVPASAMPAKVNAS